MKKYNNYDRKKTIMTKSKLYEIERNYYEIKSLILHKNS